MDSIRRQNAEFYADIPIADSEYFRLVCVLPGDFGEPIKCVLERAALFMFCEDFQKEMDSPYYGDESDEDWTDDSENGTMNGSSSAKFGVALMKHAMDQVQENFSISLEQKTGRSLTRKEIVAGNPNERRQWGSSTSEQEKIGEDRGMSSEARDSTLAPAIASTSEGCNQVQNDLQKDKGKDVNASIDTNDDRNRKADTPKISSTKNPNDVLRSICNRVKNKIPTNNDLQEMLHALRDVRHNMVAQWQNEAPLQNSDRKGPLPHSARQTIAPTLGQKTLSPSQCEWIRSFRQDVRQSYDDVFRDKDEDEMLNQAIAMSIRGGRQKASELGPNEVEKLKLMLRDLQLKTVRFIKMGRSVKASIGHLPADHQVGRSRITLPTDWVASLNALECKAEAHYLQRLSFTGYSALSYTWGARKANHTISVNGRDGFAITDNLAAALLRLRRTNRPRWFWIDAICIDQNNDTERSQQVKLMGDIYACARRVFVWLGEPDVRLKHRIRDKQVMNISIYESHLAPRNLPLRLLIQAVKETEPSWWERVWVMQEYGMAVDSPTIVYGPCEVSWNLALMMAESLTWDPRVTGIHCSHGSSLWTALQNLQNMRRLRLGTKHGLIAFATMMRQTQCQDARDKVYGYLNIASEQERAFIQPDYTQPCWKVYANATYATTLTHGDLGGLALASIGLSKRAELPTWAIDFDSCKPWLSSVDLFTLGSTIDTGPDIGTQRLPRSMLTLPKRTRFKGTVSLNPDMKHLTVSGHLVDHVTTIVRLPVPESSNYNHRRAASLRRLYQSLREFRSPATQSTSQYRLHDADINFRRRRNKKVSEACLMGKHDKSCIKFHSSVDTKLDLGDIKRGPSVYHVSDGELTRLFNDLYREFQSRLIDHTRYEPDIHAPPARILPKDLKTDSGWQENRSWLYLDRDTYELTLFTTEKGFIGLATIDDVAVGDTIGLFDLHTLPCVLRLSSSSSSSKGDTVYSFRGFASVETPASGDLETFVGNDSFARQDFVLC